MRFKKDQEVVCTNDTGWRRTRSFLGIKWRETGYAGPKLNEIVTVAEYHGDSHIVLKEYQRANKNNCINAYPERAFEPVVSIKEIEKLLEQHPTHV